MPASSSGKIKYGPDWDNASTYYNPLQIFALIYKTVLAQTKDQYLFATVYKQECSIYSFSQNTFINDQRYELFNANINSGSANGITWYHQVILSHVAEESKKKI